jgi:hypothetical protein
MNHEEGSTEWFYVLDADKFSKRVRSEPENVRHLEKLEAIGSAMLPTKISMALLLVEGKPIEEYFELEEYFEKEFFNQITSTPAYYKLPKNMKGQALG